MKKTIQPWIARAISSQWLLNFKRRFQESKRRILKQPHVVSVFVRVDDPYSYLLLQVMPELQQRYKVSFSCYVVSHLQDHMYPESALWHNNALADSRYIAQLYGLEFPRAKELPSSKQTQLVSNQLLAVERDPEFVIRATSLLKAYWSGEQAEPADGQSLSARLADNDALLESMGHYLSATLHYGGEWYWGIDRLSHLERRLNSLKLNRFAAELKYDENTKHFCTHLKELRRLPKRPVTPLTIYFSARSPYSYLGLERGVRLAKHYGIAIVIKPMLPMLMRGMPIPPRKKWYIFSDTKREALKLGLDYGFIADPLGAGVERCYALFDFAKSQNKEVEYLLAYVRAVNVRAVHSDTDQGMKSIVEEAGLDWLQAQPLLQNDDWRDWAQRNYDEMYSKGLWGVPSFEYDGVAVWGQDRLDVLERAICDSIELANR